MLDISLRALKDRVLQPFARLLRGVHPHIITLIGFGFGLSGALLTARGFYWWGLAFWVLNRVLDGLDGAVARVSHNQSDLGGYLDIMLDFVIYALVPIAVVVSAPSTTRYFFLALLLASFYVNAASWMYLSAILEKRYRGVAERGELTTVSMPTGLIGGTETFIFYCLFIALPQHAEWLFVIMGTLVIVTILQRMWWAIRHLN